MSEARSPLRGLRFAVARVTLELTTTLSIGTGHGDDVSDSVCVVDANGLPALPGTSIAGVLRAEVRLRLGEAAEHSLFGYQEKDKGGSSRVEVSWGHVHDERDRPVQPRRGPEKFDSVLAFVAAGVTRDHVRISHLGVADRTGKFDVRAVPAGARFTFELLVHDDGSDSARADLDRLVGMLASGGLRLGARSRRGAGGIRVARAVAGTFDLCTGAGRAAWSAVPRALHDGAGGLKPMKLPEPGGDALELPLEAVDHWIFGTGRAVRDDHFVRAFGGKKGSEKAHDRVPVTERRVRWDGSQGRVEAERDAPVLVPATGVKGALRHRTLFHARRLRREWASEQARQVVPEGEHPLHRGIDASKRVGATDGDALVDRLFGSVKGKGEHARGRRGLVSLSDVFVDDVRHNPLQHVSLDRFTQAPMDGLLFSEAPVAKGRFVLRLEVDPQARDDHSKDALRALYHAVLDLLEGRLALGAGANRGHGTFRADRSRDGVDLIALVRKRIAELT